MKFIEERIFRVLMLLSLLMVAGFVLSVLWSIFSKGIPVLTWEMVTSLPGAGFYIGKEGGFLNAIVGSVYIVVGATIIGLIVSIPVVFYLNVYLKGTSRFGYIARLAFDVLFGIPSIVYGAFAFTLMIVMGIKTSLLGGIIVESLLIIPILTRSMDEVARTIPKDLLEAAYSLGATKIETIGVVVRQIAPAIATATSRNPLFIIGNILLGFPRRLARQNHRPLISIPRANGEFRRGVRRLYENLLRLSWHQAEPVVRVERRLHVAALRIPCKDLHHERNSLAGVAHHDDGAIGRLLGGNRQCRLRERIHRLESCRRWSVHLLRSCVLAGRAPVDRRINFLAVLKEREADEVHGREAGRKLEFEEVLARLGRNCGLE